MERTRRAELPGSVHSTKRSSGETGLRLRTGSRPLSKPRCLLPGKGRDCPSSRSCCLIPALRKPSQRGGAPGTWEPVPQLGTSCPGDRSAPGHGGCGWRSLSNTPPPSTGSPARAGWGQRNRNVHARRQLLFCPCSLVCPSSLILPHPHPQHQLSPTQETSHKPAISSPSPTCSSRPRYSHHLTCSTLCSLVS